MRVMSDDASGRCEPVPDWLVAAISSGLKGQGRTLAAARAVKSRHFSKVWFVSAFVEGPDLEGRDALGTWATNGLEEQGLIYAVNVVAEELSDWGAGGTAQAALSMDDDGAVESQWCCRGIR